MGKFEWLKRLKKSAREPKPRPPILIGGHSNGETFQPLGRRERELERTILQRADEKARRLGLERREFLASTMGMATTLAIVNACGDETSTASGGGGAAGSGGEAGSSGDGGYQVPDAATEDADAACDLLDTSDYFIFDVQTHHVNPNGSWRQTYAAFESFLAILPQAGCGLGTVDCFSFEQYVEQVFINSDTAVAVLSGVPSAMCKTGFTGNCGNPLENEEIAESRDMVNALARSDRVVNHCFIAPNDGLSEQLALMDQLVDERGVAAWKCYTPWGPTGDGYWLDDATLGTPFIEKGIELGVPLFCCHKGLPILGFNETYTDPKDIGVVAKAYPEAKFVVYHSAFQHGGKGAEGPYDPNGDVDPQNPSQYPATVGVNSLIHSMVQNGVGPGQNVYAELGSTWLNIMTKPTQAMHVIGKLLKYVGEDNILWGTDSIWYGSPQFMIEAFKTLTISTELQEKYGYPELTDARKRKILGLNAAKLYGIDPEAKLCAVNKDQIASARRLLDESYGPRRWALQESWGPRTRREFFDLLRATGGRPG